MISYTSKSRKVYAVYHWLLQNAYIQNSKSKVNPADIKITAYHYVETLKDKIHNAHIHIDKYEGYMHTTFSIKVGHPKFRGSVNYKLPSHSLYFDSSNATSVKLLLSGDLNPKSWDNISWNTNKIQMNVHEDWWGPRFRMIAVHPHISTHGEPCLGNWSQAWSTCISTSNLISLINVTQGFLNTWTSYDAFWNINNVRRTWLRLPLEIRKFYTLNDYLILRNLWLDIGQRINTNSGPVNIANAKFVDWVNQNVGGTIAYLEMQNFNKECMVNLHMYWNGITLSKKNIADTQDRKLSSFENVYGRIYNTFCAVTDKLVDEFNLYENYSFALASDVMTDRPNWTCVNPQRSNRDNDTSPPTRVLSQINHNMQSNLRHNRSTSGMITFADIFEYQRRCRRRKDSYSITSYVSNMDMYHEFRQEHSNRTSNDSYWNSINMVIKYFNTFRHDSLEPIDFILRENIKEHKDIDAIFDTIISSEVNYLDTASIEPEERTAHYVNAALQRYGLLITEYKQRSIKNGKERYIRIPDRDRRESTSQNPVSVESF